MTDLLVQKLVKDRLKKVWVKSHTLKKSTPWFQLKNWKAPAWLGTFIALLCSAQEIPTRTHHYYLSHHSKKRDRQGRHGEIEPGKVQYSTPKFFDRLFLIRAYWNQNLGKDQTLPAFPAVADLTCSLKILAFLDKKFFWNGTNFLSWNKSYLGW